MRQKDVLGLLVEIERRTAVFEAAYHRLAGDGAADGVGGSEYHRILGEWCDAGLPTPAEKFIREAGSRPPQRPGRRKKARRSPPT